MVRTPAGLSVFAGRRCTPDSPAASWWRSRSPTAACAGRRPSRCPRARPSSSASPTSSATRRCSGAKCARRPSRAASPASTCRTATSSGRATCPRVTGASVDARYAFVSDDKGAVHALDRINGRSLWKQDRLAYRQLSLPLPLGTRGRGRRPAGLRARAGARIRRLRRARRHRRQPGARRAAATARGLPRADAGRRPVRAGAVAWEARREAGHRAGRPAQRRQVHAVQPPDAPARRDRGRRARRDARPPLRRGRVGERPFIVIDTGGLEPGAREGIFVEMARQAEQAIAEADAVMFLTDGARGLARRRPRDRRAPAQAEGARLAGGQQVRRHGEPDTAAAEFHELGLGAPDADLGGARRGRRAT